MPLQTFENLEVWKRGCRLAVDTYVATHDSNDFGLNNQMQRAAVSIPSNVAEGAERDSDKDFARFLRYAKGSCGELRTQLYISKRIQQDTPPTTDSMIKTTKEISAMLQALINSLQRKLSQ